MDSTGRSNQRYLRTGLHSRSLDDVKKEDYLRSARNQGLASKLHRHAEKRYQTSSDQTGQVPSYLSVCGERGGVRRPLRQNAVALLRPPLRMGCP